MKAKNKIKKKKIKLLGHGQKSKVTGPRSQSKSKCGAVSTLLLFQRPPIKPDHLLQRQGAGRGGRYISKLSPSVTADFFPPNQRNNRNHNKIYETKN